MGKPRGAGWILVAVRRNIDQIGGSELVLGNLHPVDARPGDPAAQFHKSVSAGSVHSNRECIQTRESFGIRPPPSFRYLLSAWVQQHGTADPLPGSCVYLGLPVAIALLSAIQRRGGRINQCSV